MCPWATSTIRIECTSLRRCDQQPRAQCRHPPAKQIVPCVFIDLQCIRDQIKSRLEQEWNSPCLFLVLLISHDCNARQSACGVVSCVSAQWPIHTHQEIMCTPKGHRDTDCHAISVLIYVQCSPETCSVFVIKCKIAIGAGMEQPLSLSRLLARLQCEAIFLWCRFVCSRKADVPKRRSFVW